MKKYSIICGLVLVLAAGCKKEEAITPSYADKNWLEIKGNGNPNDRLQAIRAGVYDEFGVSLLVKDSLGSVQGVTKYGDKYTYYEILSYGYSMTGTVWDSRNQIVYSRDSAKLIACAEVLRDQVLPVLQKSKVGPRAIMMAVPRAIYYKAQQFWGGGQVQSREYVRKPIVHKALNATIVNIDTLSKMTKTDYALRVIAEEYKGAFRKDYTQKYEDFMSNAFTKSASDVPGVGIGQYIYGAQISSLGSADIRTYGLWTYELRSGQVTFPCEDEDLSEFFYQALTKTQAEFDAANPGFSKLRSKFLIIKQVVDELGGF